MNRPGTIRGWRVWAIVAAGVGGALVSVVLYRAMAGHERDAIHARFSAAAQERINAIDLRFRIDLEVLHGLRAFYAGSKSVERNEFAAYTRRVTPRHPGLVALEWARVVEPADAERYVAEVRADGLAEFTVRERDTGTGWRPAAPGKLRAPVTYAWGDDALQRLGRDRLSDPLLRPELEAARDSGELVGGAAVVLGAQGSAGLAAAVAIYDNRLPVLDIAARRAALRGYLVGYVKVRAIVHSALAQFAARDVVLRIEDPGAPAWAPPLFEDPAFDSDSGLVKRGRIEVGGRPLSVVCRSPAGYVAAHETSAASLLALTGLALTGVLVAYLTHLTRHAARVERVVAERTETIRLVSRLHQAILDSASYSIISTDPDGTIRLFNRAAERMLGYAADEVVGHHTPEILHRRDEVERKAAELSRELGRPVPPGFGVFVERAIEGRADVDEWTYVRKDGSTFPVRLTVTALRDERGGITGFVGIAEDIARRKQAEQALIDAKAAAEEANRTKSRFLANMSHELRTPLNAILGYAEMLEEDALAEGRDHAGADLRRIHSAAHHLLQLINDMLDLSKIEAGRIELFHEEFSLRALIGEVTAMVAPLVEERRNTLEARCARDVDAMVSDVTRVRQVLFNLLSNAAKFTEDGSILLEAAAEPERPDHVRIVVRDTGIGMTEEQLARIFDPFAQADQSTTRRHGGTGLGLAICREFCTLLGGGISVESRPAEGSEFTVVLPRERPEGVPERRAPERVRATGGGHGGVVLVIDDDPSVHGMLGRVLAREGYRVVSAPDAESGLEAAREHRPTAIVLDVLLPRVDGWEVLSALKEDPELASIPVVLQTMIEDRGLGFALGAADYLVKPVSAGRLLQALARLHPGTGTGTVLIVEDDADLRALLRRSLEAEGWRAIEADDGREALARLERGPPDLVLLDLMMPGVDGFEVVDEMRRREDWREIPVIVVTARELTREDRARLNGRVARIVYKRGYARDSLLGEIRRLVQHSAGARGEV